MTLQQYFTAPGLSSVGVSRTCPRRVCRDVAVGPVHLVLCYTTTSINTVPCVAQHPSTNNASPATGVQLESKQLTSRATLSLRSLLREFHEAGAYSD